MTHYYSFYSLAICGNNIFASTYDGEIWRRPISELVWNSTKQVDGYNLFQNYPNPFNPTTKIRYSVEKEGHVKLIVYNTLGQSIKVLENTIKPAGNYSTNFNASNLPSGIYFYKLEAGQFTQVKKMMIIK